MIDPGVWVRCIDVKAGRVIVRQVERPPDLADMDTSDLGGPGFSEAARARALTMIDPKRVLP